jgi:NAD(P)H-flavin reductase
MATQQIRMGDGDTTLLFGERTQDDLMYRETLDVLSASHESFLADYVLSDEEWDGRTGHVQDHLPDLVDDANTPHFYVCGVPEMVVETTDVLSDHGAAEGHIFTEGWEEGAIAE